MDHKVCIVDDEAAIGRMCADYLKTSYEVKVFTSPVDAIAAFEKDHYAPDILITDIKMPMMDGFQMARRIHETAPNLPVVIMSGYADKNHVIEAMESQALGFLEKPFTPKKMKTTIESIIRRSDYVSSLEVLLARYSLLTNSAMELNRRYVMRYARAENRLEEASVPMFRDREEVLAYLKQIQAENRLDSRLESLLQEIEGLRKATLGKKPPEDF